MKDRIIQFLRSENKTSSQFAEEIGVQPSSVSHIISGRNNPSLDFIMKMLTRYPSLSSDWLLFGRDTMLREKKNEGLFESDISGYPSETVKDSEKQIIKDLKPSEDLFYQEHGIPELKGAKMQPWRTKRIVCFFDNNSFTEYFPSAD